MIGPSARALITTTVCATVAGAPSARAASQFDGDWVAHLFTRTGACEPNFRLSGRIVNGTANSLGAALRVAPSGAVTDWHRRRVGQLAPCHCSKAPARRVPPTGRYTAAR